MQKKSKLFFYSLTKSSNCFGKNSELPLQTGHFDIWEPATLTVKREGYSIKCSGPSGGVAAEKFSSSISVCLLISYILSL